MWIQPKDVISIEFNFSNIFLEWKTKESFFIKNLFNEKCIHFFFSLASGILFLEAYRLK